jgi:hypothetical protein
MYILPYDQYTLNAQANSGSNLYIVNLSNDPNPDSSDVGFTQGTIIHRFTGVFNTFATVNIVSSNIILLKEFKNDRVFYISSCNLITSNSNYVLYNTQASPISQELDFYLDKIDSVIAAPQNAVFFGQNYYFAGDQFTIPKYIKYTQGISYYSVPEYGFATKWLYDDNDGQIGALFTGYFYCNSEGTLYEQTNTFDGIKIRVTNLLAFNVIGKGTNILTSYYKFPNNEERILAASSFVTETSISVCDTLASFITFKSITFPCRTTTFSSVSAKKRALSLLFSMILRETSGISLKIP